MLNNASSRVALVAIAAAGLSLACGGGALISPARAQTWNGGSGNWGTTGSWTPATVPNAVGATATFNGPPSGTDFGVTLPGGPFTIGTLNLDGSTNGSGYLFQNGTLIMQATSGEATINVQTNLSTNDDFGAGALPATLQLNSTTNINTESSAATIGFASQSTIAGSGGLIFSGSGTTTLAGASTYTGATTIDTGSTVRGGAANAFSAASATTVNAGGTLDLGGFSQTVSSLSGAGVVTNSGSPLATLTNQGASSTFSGVIQDGGCCGSSATSLVQNSPGNTLILTGNSTYSGTTTIAAGTLQLGNGGTSGQISTDAIDNGTLAFDRSDIVTATGVISGTGAVTQIGTGTTTLAGANTYTGQTNVTAGTLGVTGSIGSIATPSGAISIASAGALNVGASGSVTASGLNNAGNLINNGTLSAPTITNIGTLTTTATINASTSLTTSGTMDAAGLIITPDLNNAGVFTLTNSLGGIGAFNNSGVLNLNGQILTANSVNSLGGSIGGGSLTGAINAAGGTISATLSGPSTTLTATSGTTVVSGANLYGDPTHGTTIRQARLVAAHATTGGVNDALGVGPVLLNGGSGGSELDLAAPGTSTFNNPIMIASGTNSSIGAAPGTVVTLTSSLTDSGGPGTTLHINPVGDSGILVLSTPPPVFAAGMQLSFDDGTVQLGNPSALILLAGASTVTVGGALDLNNLPNATVQDLILNGGLLENGTLSSSGLFALQSGTVSADLTGTGAASITGPVTLSGANTYTGGTTINAGGALNVIGSLGSAATPGGAFSIGSGGTLNVDLSGSINIAGSPFANSGTLNNSGSITAGGLTNSAGATVNNLPAAVINGGLTNNGTLTTTGAINGGLTNNGTTFASGIINGGIQNFSNFNSSLSNQGGFTLLGNLASDGVFSNSGMVRVDRSQTNVTLGSNTFTFINNGVLDLRNPNTVATNLTIQGNYVAQDPQINLNVLATAANTGQQQANHLTITGAASGATNVSVTPFNGVLTIFPNSIPIISVGPGSTATFTALPSATNLGSLVAFGIEQDPTNPTQWELTSHINPVPIGSIAGSVSSAVTSVATGFFQGSTAFLGAPATTTPNQVDAGVWTRGATGMNTERSAVTTSQVSGASDLKTQTHFSGYQVGSDLGMFNIQNTGWNLHGGITAGEYVASSSEANFSDGFSNFTVPFLGLYAAATGHGFFADVLVRHDFWRGEVTSAGAALTNAQMDGHGNAVTAEAGYTYHFQNGIFNGAFITPSVGFAYTNANFQQLNLLPESPFPPTLNLGAVVSDLGRFGVTLGDTFATTYWALTPNVNVSVWHEFAGAIPSVFTSAQPGQPILTDNVSETRIGTFGQFGVGLTAQPTQNPNWTLFARADWRTGSNISGGTLTGGFRYQF